MNYILHSRDELVQVKFVRNNVVVEKFENFLAVDDRGKYIPDHDEALKEMVSLVRKGASS